MHEENARQRDTCRRRDIDVDKYSEKVNRQIRLEKYAFPILNNPSMS